MVFTDKFHDEDFRHWYFIDDDLNVVWQTKEKLDLDTTQFEDWYLDVVEVNDTVFNKPRPNIFTNHLTLNISTPLKDNQGVIGFDVSLDRIANAVKQLKITPDTVPFIFTSNGQIISHPSIPITSLGQDGSITPNSLHDHDDPILSKIQMRFDKGSIEIPRIHTIDDREYMTYLSEIITLDTYGIYLGLAAPIDELNADADVILIETILLSMLIIFGGVVFIRIIGKRISKPIIELTAVSDEIRALNLNYPVVINSRIIEIKQLAHSLERMRLSLQAFGQYVPKQLVQKILQSPLPIEVGGRSKNVTVLFTDIANFSVYAEQLTPVHLLNVTSDYFTIISDIINIHQGIVDKYIGDSVMALWNTPNDDPDHIKNACLAALCCKDKLDVFNYRMREKGLPEFHTRFGIHTGNCIIGNVGSNDRLNYTAFGATVNLASRLESLNKDYGSQIITSEEVYKAVQREFDFKPMGSVIPQGFSSPVHLYELLQVKAVK
ncbi:adenylate/guanylate cyclase domain-containing protein [Curvivirga sp.]|uniref:adenylate/guanylate cyclase domain-containing protein n=1 Tax=Curvivirga sp. TaxID=2856848 RepID=UPI003B5AB214